MRIDFIPGYFTYHYYEAYKAKSLGQTGQTSEVQQVGQTQEKQPPQQAQETKAPQTPPEIAAFMAKLGLQPTNSKEGDQAAITTKLAELEAVAKTDTEKQKVSDLRAELNEILQNIQPPPPPQAPGELAGLEQLGAMNKLFMLQQ